MRILYIIPFYKPAYGYGGPVRSASALCEALACQGADVWVYTTNVPWPGVSGNPCRKSSASSPVLINNVNVLYFPLGLLPGNFYSPALVAALNEHISEFDLVICEALWEIMVLPIKIACAEAKRPYLVKPSGQLYPWALGQGSLKKAVYMKLIGRDYLNRAIAILSTCQEEASALAGMSLAAPVWIVPNGINPAVYNNMPERGLWRGRFGIPEQAKVLLLSGRLTRIKRPDIAVKVCAGLHTIKNLPAYLILAGPDEDRMTDQLKRLAAQKGVERFVFFTGLLDEEQLLSALADADLLLMPTEVQENFGLAALEGLASGLPVLTSAGIPVGKHARSAGAGRVADVTPEAFTQAAFEMLSDPDELTEMGSRARRLAFQDFDINRIALELFRKLNVMLGSHAPSDIEAMV